MDEVVVDSSVAIKWFVAEAHSTEAQRLLSEYQTGLTDALTADNHFAQAGFRVLLQES